MKEIEVLGVKIRIEGQVWSFDLNGKHFSKQGNDKKEMLSTAIATIKKELKLPPFNV